MLKRSSLSGGADTFTEKPEAGQRWRDCPRTRAVSLGPELLALGLTVSSWQCVLVLTSLSSSKTIPHDSLCTFINEFTGSIWKLHSPQAFHLSKLSKDYFWWSLCLGSCTKRWRTPQKKGTHTHASLCASFQNLIMQDYLFCLNYYINPQARSYML